MLPRRCDDGLGCHRIVHLYRKTPRSTNNRVPSTVAGYATYLDELHEVLPSTGAVARPVQLQHHGSESRAVLHQGLQGVVIEPWDKLDHHLYFMMATK